MERYDQDKDVIKVASRMMEIITMQIFTDHKDLAILISYTIQTV
jgi:hypothetical protein